jgi:hypothetical protein
MLREDMPTNRANNSKVRANTKSCQSIYLVQSSFYDSSTTKQVRLTMPYRQGKIKVLSKRIHKITTRGK